MYTIRIESAEKITVQDSGEHMLSVLFSIRNGEEKVSEARHGFPLGTTAKELEAHARKVLETFVSDLENATRNAQFEAANKQADDTISDVVGREITQ